MKKLLGIVVVSLLWCNLSYANESAKSLLGIKLMDDLNKYENWKNEFDSNTAEDTWGIYNHHIKSKVKNDYFSEMIGVRIGKDLKIYTIRIYGKSLTNKFSCNSLTTHLFNFKKEKFKNEGYKFKYLLDLFGNKMDGANKGATFYKLNPTTDKLSEDIRLESFCEDNGTRPMFIMVDHLNIYKIITPNMKKFYKGLEKMRKEEEKNKEKGF